MSWRCPTCKSTTLEVTITTWARLIQEDDGNFQTDIDEAEFHDHEWSSSTSIMRCVDCGEQDIAEKFLDEEDEDEEETDGPKH